MSGLATYPDLTTFPFPTQAAFLFGRVRCHCFHRNLKVAVRRHQLDLLLLLVEVLPEALAFCIARIPTDSPLLHHLHGPNDGLQEAFRALLGVEVVLLSTH